MVVVSSSLKILQFKLVLLTDFSVGSTGTGGVLTVGNRAGSTLHGHANIVSITGPGMPNDTGGGAVALPPQMAVQHIKVFLELLLLVHT